MGPPVAIEASANIAIFGMALYFLCSVVLRYSLKKQSPVFLELFAQPITDRGPAGSWLLRVKYFAPWVPSPSQVAHERPFIRIMLWGSRLGGFMLVVGMAATVAFFIYFASRGAA